MNGRSVRTKLFGGAARTRAVAAAAAVAVLLFIAATAIKARTRVNQGGEDQLSGRYATSHTIGLVPGQTLRVTVLSPDRQDEGGGSARAHVKVFGPNGELLHETSEADVPAGGFRSFDVNRRDIPLAGDPRTGAATVHVSVVVDSFPSKRVTDATYGANNSGHGYVNAGTLQLIDDESGKTLLALLLPAVQKVREAAR